MKISFQIIFIFLFLSSSIISGCNYDRQNETPESGSSAALGFALSESIKQLIVPAFNNFKIAADTFQAQSGVFCEAVNQQNLLALQNQWKSLSTEWNGIAIYNIGPLNNDLILPEIIFIESMRQRGIDYTNTIRGDLSARLADTTPLNQNYFENLNFTYTGMLALEVLTFENSNSPHATDAASIVNDYQSNSRKCEYLNGMSRLISQRADNILNGWQTDFQNSGKAFKDILIDGELDDGSQSVPALITTVQEHLDYIKRRKLEAILDARLSNFFFENILATLQQIELLLEGQQGQLFSFFSHMENSGFTEQANLIRQNINTAQAAAEEKNRSALTTAIGVLDGNFKRELPDSLNVTLSFNFTDGD